MSLAGGPVVIRFRLGGFQGADPAATVPTVPALQLRHGGTHRRRGAGHLRRAAPLFIPVVNNYVYTWQTSRAWRGTCATFTLTLDDGDGPHCRLPVHVAVASLTVSGDGQTCDTPALLRSCKRWR